MSPSRFDWQRFWCPPTESFSLADGGYLADPVVGDWVNPSCVTFPFMQQHKTLALLGEPGIGKSTALKTEYDDQLYVNGGQTIAIKRDLRSFSDTGEFRRRLFDDPSIAEWLQGQGTLDLFLDSLDECLLSVPAAMALLLDWISSLPVDRLKLRIACRTAQWSQDFSAQLSEIAHEQVASFELLPLRRIDVETAASEILSEARPFMEQLDDVGAVPLAIKPVTLNMLLRMFLEHQYLPSVQSRLYEAGCLALCGDSDMRTRNQGPTLSPSERVAVAARLAYLSIFGNRYAIDPDAGLGSSEPSSMSIVETTGGNSSFGAAIVEVDERAVDETLDTGLFSSRGGSRMGWSHQTYAEYLAARHLMEMEVEPEQVVALFTLEGTSGMRRLVPQLEETAAWLASLSPIFFQQLRSLDPTILLYSDVATADETERRLLLEDLLREDRARALWSKGWMFRRRLKRLSFGEIGEVIEPLIRDRDAARWPRLLALQVAGECEVEVVDRDLLRVALNPAENELERFFAIRAVGQIGKAESIYGLKPLLQVSNAEDPNDELRGEALKQLWPRYLSVDELLAAISEPHNDSYIGSYAMFLRSRFVEALDDEDLGRVLGWAATLPASWDLSYSTRELLENVYLEASRRVAAGSPILPQLAAAAAARVERHDDLSLFDPGLFPNADEADRHRRELLLVVLADLEEPEKAGLLLWGQWNLVKPTDLDWMLDSLSSADAAVEAGLAALAARLFDFRRGDQAGRLLAASATSAALKIELDPYLRAVDISSDEADRQRSMFRRSTGESVDSEDTQDDINADVGNLLTAFQEGDTDAWWRMNVRLAGAQGDEFESDLTLTPGWKVLSTNLQADIIHTAAAYLERAKPEESSWRSPGIFYRPARAAARAFRLLHAENPGGLDKLPTSVWRFWMPLIVWYPDMRGSEERRAFQLIACAGYRRTGSTALRALRSMLRSSSEILSATYAVQKFEDCWDERVSQTVASALGAGDVDHESLGFVLGELLRRDSSRGLRTARKLMSQTAGNGDRQQRMEVGVQLLASGMEQGWRTIKRLITTDPELASDILQSYSHERRGLREGDDITQAMSERDIAMLYTWLLEQFPRDSDPDAEGAHYVTQREDVGRFRDQLISVLGERANEESIRALARLASREGTDYLKQVVAEAERTLATATWNPLSIRALKQLLWQPAARLVNSGADLIVLVTASLDRFQQVLQGENGWVSFLWEAGATDGIRPKPEEDLSDLIKLHLEQDLEGHKVVVNREVQVMTGRRGRYGGKRTDIHVDAFSEDSKGGVSRIRLTIEVKPSWSRELSTGLKEQLVERYLLSHRTALGIYVAAKYDSPVWETKDWRRTASRSLNWSAALSSLNADAHSAREEGVDARVFALDCTFAGGI